MYAIRSYYDGPAVGGGRMPIRGADLVVRSASTFRERAPTLASDSVTVQKDPNMGGIVQKVYFGFWADVETWPTKPTNPADIEANGVLTGTVVMKAGKRMFEMYITDDTGEFNIESVGEVDGKSFVEHLTFFRITSYNVCYTKLLRMVSRLWST